MSVISKELVLFYEGEHYMFSNFSAFAIKKDGEFWMTAEHLYQAEKFTDRRFRNEIQWATSAHAAKMMARIHPELKRPDWDEQKLSVMERILRLKIDQHPYVRQKLIETGDCTMVEDSPKDSFWGRGEDWKGKNHLGRLWMKIREEIRERSVR